jgi:hypothetical protein
MPPKKPSSAPTITSLIKCIPRSTLKAARHKPKKKRTAEKRGCTDKESAAIRNIEKTWREGNDLPNFSFGRAL